MGFDANVYTDELLSSLEQSLTSASSTRQSLQQAIATAPFEHNQQMGFLFLGFICLYEVDEAAQLIRLVGYTDNEYYQRAIQDYPFDPQEYTVSLTDTDNSISQAIQQGESVSSANWDSLRRPKVEEGVARLNQASAGIGLSVVYPLPGTTKGALMYNYYQYPEDMGDDQIKFMESYTTLAGRVLDRASNNQ